ncbi:hypothetical protein F4804DRAFT_22588 [Jackrogersella minutella]|nr:hypothetical protein F4804DRAFT_22588 [Jackrogersella minutella]
MLRQKKNQKKSAPSKKKDTGPPAPFKRPPEVLQPLIETLDEKHAYIIHIDDQNIDSKRQMFAFPLIINVVVAGLFVYRMYYILPYYLAIVASVLGYPNETTMVVDEMDWPEIATEVGKRTFSFMLDFLLYAFIWFWPVNFFLGQEDGNPAWWRLRTGFRNREIVVRRSNKWDETKGDVVNDSTASSLFMLKIGHATSSTLLKEKTGMLLVTAEWNLDYRAMVDATTMVDKKMAALEAFQKVVLVFHEEYGWLSIDMKANESAEEDVKRRQVLAFRDALRGMDKEALFYRWVEVIQFESSSPDGFGPEKQERVAEQIREMFLKEGVDFDRLWKDSAGEDAPRNAVM